MSVKVRTTPEELAKLYPLQGRLLRSVPDWGLTAGQIIKFASMKDGSVTVAVDNPDGTFTLYDVLDSQFEAGSFEDAKPQQRRAPVTK